MSEPIRLMRRMARRTGVGAGLLALVLVASARPLVAWGPKGHLVVAAVAYRGLTPAARARADALLMLNPDHARWRSAASAVPAADRGLAVFMLAAGWADDIRDNPSYGDDGIRGGNVPRGPTSAQNIGYSDRFRHKYWHFVNQPFTQAGQPLPRVETPNALERIPLFLAVLASRAPDALKSYDLTWLLHLIADVHQPLHASTRVVAGDANGDEGGNDVLVCVVPGCSNPRRLHGFWDGLLGSDVSLTAAMTTARGLVPADARRAAALDPAVWVKESFDLARNQVYRSPVGPGRGPHTLTVSYQNDARTLAREQAALGGARLAAVLNRDLVAR